MRITQEQFDAASNAACEATLRGGESLYSDDSLRAALKVLGIEVVEHAGADGDCPDYGSRLDPCPPGCAMGTCIAGTHGDEFTWPTATWADVREGDVVRAGEGAKEGMVVKIGPVSTRAQSEARFRHVELISIEGHRAVPPHGMNPQAAVQIRVTRRELAAIELLGGWANRVSAALPG